MKITWAMVETINGKTTNGEDPNIYSWTSPEDSQFFFDLLSKNKLIVMGSKTYEAARKVLKLDGQRLRIVLTKSPEKYASEIVKGELEFSDEVPNKLVQRLTNEGYSEMLLVSGSKVGTTFLKEKLIDELHLTIEPRIFGKGTPLIQEENLDISMQLTEYKTLNQKGTLYLKYKIEK